MGVPALCMAALSFPIAAVSIILSAAFQSLGHSGSSLLIALLRQILLLLPIAALFLWLVPDGVWLSFLIAETITCVATLLLYRRDRPPPDRRTGGPRSFVRLCFFLTLSCFRSLPVSWSITPIYSLIFV